MAGFKGKFEHAVDDKGRFSFPSKLRKALNPEANDSFVITRGYENSLAMYPLDAWNRFEEQMRAELNTHRKEDRRFIRYVMMWAQEVTLDRQSRIMMPHELMKFAGITGQVVVLGALETIELWSPENFREYSEFDGENSVEEIGARVMGGT
jgi:MraZ protein